MNNNHTHLPDINNTVILTILEMIAIGCLSFIGGIMFERCRFCRRERYVV